MSEPSVSLCDMHALKRRLILTAFSLTLYGFKDAHFCQLCNFSV